MSDLWLGIAVLVEQRDASELDATILRPRREDEPGRGLHLASIRQRIESIFWTCKDILTLDRYGARTFAGLRERPSTPTLPRRPLTLNYHLDRPNRAFVNYYAEARDDHLAAQAREQVLLNMRDAERGDLHGPGVGVVLDHALLVRWPEHVAAKRTPV